MHKLNVKNKPNIQVLLLEFLLHFIVMRKEIVGMSLKNANKIYDSPNDWFPLNEGNCK